MGEFNKKMHQKTKLLEMFDKIHRIRRVKNHFTNFFWNSTMLEHFAGRMGHTVWLILRKVTFEHEFSYYSLN